MQIFNRRAAVLALPLLAFLRLASATTTTEVSFEELVDRSEVVATGTIARSWTAWDAEGKYIWTHYSLSITSVQKGRQASAVEFAEPGGVVGERGTMVAGSVQYQVGDSVLIFLERMPNGYLRTTAWEQGKFTVDSQGKVHAAGARALLDGTTLVQAKSLVGARLKAQGVR